VKPDCIRVSSAVGAAARSGRLSIRELDLPLLPAPTSTKLSTW
jgi:hypothetical protein